MGEGDRAAWAPDPPSPPGCPAGRTPASVPGATRRDTANSSGPSSRRPWREPAPSEKSLPPARGRAHNRPPSLGRSRGGGPPTRPRGAAAAGPALVCSRAPGPAPAAPRSARGESDPGGRGRLAAAPGRGAGGGARGAAAAKPGGAWGVGPGEGQAAHRNRAGVASLDGLPAPLLAARAEAPGESSDASASPSSSMRCESGNRP